MSKRLRPSEPTIDLWKTTPTEFHPTQGHSMVYRPDTELQALMESAPHEEPAESWDTMHDKREYAADLIETLDDSDQFVIHAIFYQRMSLRKIGTMMGRDKNWVARKRDGALRRMRASGL
jgi:DNA-directed RNA polymerase specialized sigma subunit